jgi:hypothetical protein
MPQVVQLRQTSGCGPKTNLGNYNRSLVTPNKYTYNHPEDNIIKRTRHKKFIKALCHRHASPAFWFTDYIKNLPFTSIEQAGLQILKVYLFVNL